MASIAVSGDGERWVLVNATTDVSSQLRRDPALWPTGRRQSPISALLLTDANVDHTAGLLEFRQAEAFSVYSTRPVKETLCAGPMFAQFARARSSWRDFDLAGASQVRVAELGGVTIRAIAVGGRLPAYAGGAVREGAAVAYGFEHGGARAVYAPIFLTFDHDFMREAERADAVFLDGTCWTDDEMIALGLGARTASDMGHAPMAGPGGSLARLRGLRARHRYYTHVNNSNPILDPASTQARELAAAGFSVPDDGLEIVLDGDDATQHRGSGRSVR